MSITPTGGAEAAPPHDAAHGHAQGPLYKLAIGAIDSVDFCVILWVLSAIGRLVEVPKTAEEETPPRIAGG